MTEQPASLYKYLLPERTVDVLQKLLIRFTQASSLNDALEFKPVFKGMGTRAQIEDGVRERLLAKYPDITARLESLHGPQKAAQLMAELVSMGADSVGSEVNYERSIKEIYRRLDENFGILSLSETPTSPLMWSHYSDGGRGFLIEFDAQHAWFWGKKEERDSFRHLRKIEYLERTPHYLLGTPDQAALYTKSIEWSYEKEWRIIRNFNDAAIKCGRDNYDKDVMLFAVPASSIKSVVVGYKATRKSVEQMRAAIESNTDLSHVGVKHAILDKDGAIQIAPDADTTATGAHFPET
jgi:hypothetical protein